MTRPEPTPITINDRGHETHPTFGMAQVNRVSSTGSNLFDSELTHREFVRMRINTATRKRELNHDWIYTDERVIEVEFSLAQWGAFVSSFGSGGVPCTISSVQGVDYGETPHDPRTAHSIAEVRGAGDKALAEIRGAFQQLAEAFEAGLGKKEIRQRIADLGTRIGNGPANMAFAAKSLVEHVEHVVDTARADVEAMVLQAAAQHGIEGPKAATLELLMGGDEATS